MFDLHEYGEDPVRYYGRGLNPAVNCSDSTAEKFEISVETFQLMQAGRLAVHKSVELRLRVCTQHQVNPQCGGKLFHPENKVHLFAHQAFLPHRRDASDRYKAAM